MPIILHAKRIRLFGALILLAQRVSLLKHPRFEVDCPNAQAQYVNSLFININRDGISA